MTASRAVGRRGLSWVLLIGLVAGACSGSGVAAGSAPRPAGSASEFAPGPGAASTATRDPVPTPTATPTATPISASAAAAPCLAAGPTGPFLATNGASFTCEGRPVRLTGFTFYPALLGGARAWHDPSFLSYIDHVLDMGVAAGQNLIRATDQWDPNATGQSADDPIVWANMDYLVRAARTRGIFVVIDLSAYKWLLMSQHKDASNPDLWTSFIDSVAARYRDQPGVALYSIVGEPSPPTSQAQAQSLLDFYRKTSASLRQADPNHLITVGGFNHMEDHPELGWWQAIDALPDNDVVGVKTYSQHDLNLMPAIAAYGRSVGKPVLDEEFGMPQGYGDAAFAGGSAYNGLSVGRAAFFESVYGTGDSLGFAGFIFWNMGCQMGPTSFEVNPSTPAAWSVVVANGSRSLTGASPAPDPALCP